MVKSSLNSDLNSFGGRLKSARNETKMSARRVVKIMNGYVQGKGLKAIDINTYYSWERIGTEKELMSGKSFPHPVVYGFLCTLFGITGYWLFYGDMGGQIERKRESYAFPKSTDVAIEQRTAVTAEERKFAEIEVLFRKYIIAASPKQRDALKAFLETLVE